jgi:glyceraldehyde-3-phosphate dehydrogenase (ferredoxin)
MDSTQRVLYVDASTSFYKIERFKVGDYFGPVDLGLHLTTKYNSLNFGTGLLAGSIFPGSNRLFFSGFSPCWGGFYISSMGGAGLVFDDIGVNMVSIVGKATTPSVLYLNRVHGEEIEVKVVPVNLEEIWSKGRKGVYSLMDEIYSMFGDSYINNPRIFTSGPAALASDFGALVSVPIINKKLTYVDTWAGRGGFGSKMLQEHGIAGVIYGGTYLDEDFRDRKVADEWFEQKYNKKMVVKDMEATQKYRFDPKFGTGGTLGVNYATVGGKLLAFNYKTIYMKEQERLDLHKEFITDHYLKQFNEETIEKKQQKNCGEPCAALCKKMNGEYKKDYEPYQALGPLCGVFDQRSAEKLNHHADMYGFDAISAGGVVSWLMECLDEKLLTPEELGIDNLPKFEFDGFNLIEDSKKNAEIGVKLLDSIINKKGILDLKNGARAFGKKVHEDKGINILDKFVYTSFGRKGWMVPNQYWVPGVLSPMAIMGKYYMYYGNDFVPPRTLGRMNAERLKKELFLDNIGFCRFHRGWAEEMIPDVIESLFGLKDKFIEKVNKTACIINSRNASGFWESQRNIDYIYTYLKRKHEIEDENREELLSWIKRFEQNDKEAALDFWYEIHKGIHESLKEF